MLDFLHKRLYTCDMARKIDWSKHNQRRDVEDARRSQWEDEAYQRETKIGKIRFGKHKGKTLKEVPMLYLRWIKNTWLPNSKFAKAMIDNATHEISRRQHSTQENTNKGCKS